MSAPAWAITVPSARYTAASKPNTSCKLASRRSDAAHRLDALGAARVVAELLAEPRDVHVDGAVERILGVALGELHQLLAAEHAAGALGEHVEERELVAGEVEALAAELGDARAGV